MGFSNCINLRWSVILTLSGSCSGNLFKFYSSQRPKHEGRHQQKRNVYFPALPKSSRRKCFISTTTCLFVICTRLGSDGKKTRELDVFEASPDELLLRDCPVPVPEERNNIQEYGSVWGTPTCPSCWTCPQLCHGSPPQASGSIPGSPWPIINLNHWNQINTNGWITEPLTFVLLFHHLKKKKPTFWISN